MAPREKALQPAHRPTLEPVFGNIRHDKRLNRFTMRGQHKEGVQWRLYRLVHNIEKLGGSDLKK